MSSKQDRIETRLSNTSLGEHIKEIKILDLVRQLDQDTKYAQHKKLRHTEYGRRNISNLRSSVDEDTVNHSFDSKAQHPFKDIIILQQSLKKNKQALRFLESGHRHRKKSSVKQNRATIQQSGNLRGSQKTIPFLGEPNSSSNVKTNNTKRDKTKSEGTVLLDQRNKANVCSLEQLVKQNQPKQESTLFNTENRNSTEVHNNTDSRSEGKNKKKKSKEKHNNICKIQINNIKTAATVSAAVVSKNSAIEVIGTKTTKTQKSHHHQKSNSRHNHHKNASESQNHAYIQKTLPVSLHLLPKASSNNNSRKLLRKKLVHSTDKHRSDTTIQNKRTSLNTRTVQVLPRSYYRVTESSQSRYLETVITPPKYKSASLIRTSNSKSTPKSRKNIKASPLGGIVIQKRTPLETKSPKKGQKICSNHINNLDSPSLLNVNHSKFGGLVSKKKGASSSSKNINNVISMQSLKQQGRENEMESPFQCYFRGEESSNSEFKGRSSKTSNINTIIDNKRISSKSTLTILGSGNSVHAKINSNTNVA